MADMTPRERVLRAARREETDRTPLDFSGWQSVLPTPSTNTRNARIRRIVY